MAACASSLLPGLSGTTCFESRLLSPAVCSALRTQAQAVTELRLTSQLHHRAEQQHTGPTPPTGGLVLGHNGAS